MISGTSLRRTTVLLALASAVAHAAEVDTASLLARLSRPPPDATTFLEVRFSNLLSGPLVISGRLEHRTDGALVREVLEPYRETTTLAGEHVRLEREGSPPRSFSLDRAPELRGMLSSFAALLAGDLEMLERHFAVTTRGTNDRWQIELLPLDVKLKRRLARIEVDGTLDRARCFTTTEPDGDASVMVLGVPELSDLPQPVARESLVAWCSSGAEP
jgi:hypothetical protein